MRILQQFQEFQPICVQKEQMPPQTDNLQKTRHLCRFWFSICCSFYRTYITLFANRFLGGTYGYAMGAEYTMRCSRHQTAGGAHGANTVSCISQCQIEINIATVVNKVKSGIGRVCPSNCAKLGSRTKLRLVLQLFPPAILQPRCINNRG